MFQKSKIFEHANDKNYNSVGGSTWSINHNKYRWWHKELELLCSSFWQGKFSVMPSVFVTSSSSCRTETWRCKCLDWRSHAIFIQSLLKGTSKLCGISRRCLRCEHYTVLLHAPYISPRKYITVFFFFFLFCFVFIHYSYTAIFLLSFFFIKCSYLSKKS